ncbi:MAG TPA: hypothetical protein ENF53_01590 [Thermoprotei archaeon]|nr:hypothetical protein [Thermoprotei archaeon]
MKAGYGRLSITPPIGERMAGYPLRRDFAADILDELYARALSLKDGDEVYVIVSVDLFSVDIDMSNLAKCIISERTGVPMDRISIVATHTHSGPDVSGIFYGVSKHVRGTIISKIASAAILSLKHMYDVGIKQSVGLVEGIAVNRRAPRKGAIDSRVHAIGFVDRSSLDYKFIIASFSCHPVILGPSNLCYSADYPGAFNSFIERITEARSIFLNGACGDVNPLTPSTRLNSVYDRSSGTYDEVKWMGRILACEAVKSLDIVREESNLMLKVIGDELKVNIRKPMDLKEAKERYRRIKDEAKRSKTWNEEVAYRLWRAKRAYNILLKFKDRDRLNIRISALGLSNNLAIVFLPSEVFVEIGLKIKKDSPFRNTVIVSYANEYFGYIPTAKAFNEGGYEADFPVSIVPENTEEEIVSKTLEVLYRLERYY